MKVTEITRQVSAGIIVGISAVIYSVTYGALLFAGALSPFVGYAITITLITAVVGALFGWLSQGKSFISGPDSNTVSVLASMLAVLGAAGLPEQLTLHLAVGTIFLTSFVCAVAFYAIARANLAGLVRYIPFSVMAGFLASTGWLMVSGALNIIAGTPLTLIGTEALLMDPFKPQLAAGLLVAAALFGFARKIPAPALIPLVMVIASIVINVFLASHLCDGESCSRAAWMFSDMHHLPWLAPWQLTFDVSDLHYLVEGFPGMLAVAFVGLLTILVSVASLEFTHHREFDLNTVLRAHALSTGLSAGVGGFTPILSIGRTMLNRQLGGGAIAGIIAAAICLATLFGAAGIITYIPKAALGGLILYLGLGMLKQWLWDQIRAATRLELAQILLIVALVASYGFLVGFAAGMLIACVVFVFTYSRIPLADLSTNLAVFASTVMRPDHEIVTLSKHGHNTLLYRLSGYVFFGSASKIEAVFRDMDATVDGVILDFTNVSGVDRSAIGVFQRILRRYKDRDLSFYIVTSPANAVNLYAIAPKPNAGTGLQYFEFLDHAVEVAEEVVIAKSSDGGSGNFALFDDASDRTVFLGYCEMRHVRQGDALCAEGELSDQVFFVESGSLEVVKAGKRRLAKLRQGAMVGEQGFYTGDARTAAIVAATDASVYVLSKEALSRLRAVRPDLATQFDHIVIHKVSHALTRTSTLLAMYR